MTDRGRPPAPGPVVWIDLESAPSTRSPLQFGTEPSPLGWNGSFGRHQHVEPADHTFIRQIMRPFSWLATRLSATPSEDLRRWSSMDVTCRVKRSATEAVEAIGRTRAIEWGNDRRPSRLSIESIRHERSALGGPRLADAVIRGQRTGEIDLTIAVFEGNGTNCFVQLRRVGRGAWGIRRRRRCMTATHDAADRLVEQILAVDFRPQS